MDGSRGWVRFWRRAAVHAVAAMSVSGLRVLALASPASVSVVVRELPGAGDGPERAIARAGGEVGLALPIIGGYAARVPVDALKRLTSVPGVHSVTPDAPVKLQAATEVEQVSKYPSSMYAVAQEVTGAGEMWNDGWTGKGVDVAVIDSGVVPVDGLRTPGKVVNGPDLSFESDVPQARHLDTYGHGTHMAGIIAGRDDDAPAVVEKGDNKHFLGMAPDARIVSIKVADASGATDVSQVIAAIDWVVQHRNRDGLNIRVLNLSFGTDAVQDYRVDPLAYAAEVAWRHGIVVVVAGGNGGYGSAKLNNPAYDPYVLAVGGADGHATYGVADDTIPSWSSTGDGGRNPDVVAPGGSIVSLADEGSMIDVEHPSARVGTRFLRGSGTSQAAAVVSGAVALLLQQRPGMTPDQVKALLRSTAQRLPAADPVAQGAGIIDLKRARGTATPSARQTWPTSDGSGSLELARGSAHAELDGAVLTGERDAFGGVWDGVAWSGTSWTGTSWSGGAWTGASWAGSSWSGGTWSGKSWSGKSWSSDEWGD
jgi:Subtilase family